MSDEPKRRGRPKGAKKTPELHPNTVAALAGRFTIGIGAPPTTKRQNRRGLAATGSTLDPRLVELVFRIESGRGDDDPISREVRHDDLKKLGHVSFVAASIGDVAFFSQMASALELAKKCGGIPLRLLVLEAWEAARETQSPPLLSDIREGVKYRLGRFDPSMQEGDPWTVIPGHIERDTLRDHLVAMGLVWDARGNK